jgi:bacteriocin-like protein
MTDDFIVLSDAELDQVSGGDNPWLSPGQHHGPVLWGELGALPSYNSITPVRAGWTSAWAANA